jgi:predicted nucleotide-binding protein (sugar kinase/HSP70/actin superfamily)
MAYTWYNKVLNAKNVLEKQTSKALSSYFIQVIAVKQNAIKPVHVVTSIKQSPVLKGHIFLVLS